MLSGGKRFPLAYISGTPITEDKKFIGALFGLFELNDVHAQEIKEQYFGKNVDIAFFTSANSILGSSFSDNETKKTITSYLGLIEGRPYQAPTEQLHTPVKVANKYVYIDVISLSGSSIETPRFAIIVYPAQFEAFVIIETAILIALFILIAQCLHSFIFKRKEWDVEFRFSILVAILLFITVFGILYVRSKNLFVKLSPSPYPIYNSTLSLIPDSDVLEKQYKKHIIVSINTGEEAVNVVDTKIKYDPSKVSVGTIDTSYSICQEPYFIENSVDEEVGEIKISCLIPSPGFSGSSGVIADILLQPIATGTFSLSFDKETRVLANDGLGTNVLRDAVGGAYQIHDATRRSKEDVIVFSPTHPDADRWYNKNTVRFFWRGWPTARFLYTFSSDPQTSILTGTSTVDTSAIFMPKKSGTYYFSILPTVDGITGPVVTVPVKIDLDSPNPPKIMLSQSTAHVGDIVRVNFTSYDAMSGISPIYYISFDDSILLPVKPPMYLPITDRGDKKLLVRAFDKAGNISEATTTIIVR